jgi:hypothetical protein
VRDDVRGYDERHRTLRFVHDIVQLAGSRDSNVLVGCMWLRLQHRFHELWRNVCERQRGRGELRNVWHLLWKRPDVREWCLQLHCVGLRNGLLQRNGVRSLRV